jgi:prepilin-type N-terminal cleavage/methylation domain-containing protein/prepilin-type processing-associated H-X9-DG protein
MPGKVKENSSRYLGATRLGFTVIELLVAIAIIGVLTALLMPAVQSARASARRLQCKNQLRQLGLGLHLYHDSHLCFPPGSFILGSSFPTQTGWGWGSMILPSIDQGNLYKLIDFGHGNATGSNLGVIATTVPLWRCPSDTDLQVVTSFPINNPPYNLASGNYCGSEGILFPMSCVRIAQISDGTSQTFLLGERLVQPGAGGSLPYTSSWCGQVAFANGYDSCSIPHLMPNRYHYLNVSEVDPNCFGSRHTGGANFLLADGSLSFINNSIDLRVYEALGTTNGGEVVQVP